MSSNSSRNYYFEFIDLAKGFGIILVIMGHTIFPVHEAISLFHMPLFFILSGITLKLYSSFECFLLKKIDRIFIPYLFFSILSWCIARLFGYEGEVTNGPLWFLQSLFFAIIVCEIAIKRSSNYCILFLLLCAVYSWVSLNVDESFFPFDIDFDRTIRAIVFVLLGFYMKELVFCKRSLKFEILYAIAFSLIWLTLTYFSVFRMGATGNFLEGEICKYNIFMFYLTAIFGSLMVIFISKCLKSINLINWFGKNSLIIMCVHYPFLQWWNPMISSISFYKDGNLINKGLIALLSYVVALSFSCALIPLFKRFVPKMTGFKALLSADKT